MDKLKVSRIGPLIMTLKQEKQSDLQQTSTKTVDFSVDLLKNNKSASWNIQIWKFGQQFSQKQSQFELLNRLHKCNFSNF